MRESDRFLELKTALRTALAGGRFDEARELACRAVAEAERCGDQDTVDLAVCNRSMVGILEGRYDDSSEMAALRPILVRTQDSTVAFAAAYAASAISRDRRDLRKALFYARIAREKALADPGHPGRGHAFNQLGTLYLMESQVPEAIEAFRSARQAFAELGSGDPMALAILDDNLGYACLLDGRHVEGFELCHRSIAAFERLGARAYLAQPHLDLCFGYLETQRLDEARRHGEIALGLARAEQVEDVLKNGLYLLGEARYLSGDAAGADECFGELAGLYPEVRYLKDFLFSVDLKKVINLRL